MSEYSSESKILAIIPKIPAVLSIAGSIYIVQNVLRHKDKRKSIYNRLMLGISISDILASHAYFLGTWLIPRGSGKTSAKFLGHDHLFEPTMLTLSEPFSLPLFVRIWYSQVDLLAPSLWQPEPSVHARTVDSSISSQLLHLSTMSCCPRFIS